MLASQVADNLAVWEHKLDAALPLDARAEAGLGLTLARYPAGQRVSADVDRRVDLGGGAVLDVYAHTASAPAHSVTVSFGQAWLLVFGRSPPSHLVSDGNALWA